VRAAVVVVAAGCACALVAELVLGAIGVFAAFGADVRIAAMESLTAGLRVRAGGILRATGSLHAVVTAEDARRAGALALHAVEVGIARIVAVPAVRSIGQCIDACIAAAGESGLAIGVTITEGAERDATAVVTGEAGAAIGIGVATRSIQSALNARSGIAGAQAALGVLGAALAAAGALIGACVINIMADPGTALVMRGARFAQAQQALIGTGHIAICCIADAGGAHGIANLALRRVAGHAADSATTCQPGATAGSIDERDGAACAVVAGVGGAGIAVVTVLAACPAVVRIGEGVAAESVAASQRSGAIPIGVARRAGIARHDTPSAIASARTAFDIVRATRFE
jgi:hypothetical protein